MSITNYKVCGEPLYPICCFSIENVVSERDRAMCVVTNRHDPNNEEAHNAYSKHIPQGVHSLGSISTTFIVHIHADLAGMPLCGVYTRWRAFRR